MNSPINPKASHFYVFATERAVIQVRQAVDEPLRFIDFLRIRIRKYNLPRLIKFSESFATDFLGLRTRPGLAKEQKA